MSSRRRCAREVPAPVRAKRGPRRPQALLLLRGAQHYGVVAEVFARSALTSCRRRSGTAQSSGLAKRASGVCRPYISYERCSANVPAVLTYCAPVKACGRGPAGSASLKSLTSGAAPCHRAGFDHVLCSRQCARKGGPAASAGFIYLTRDAVPYHRTRCVHVLSSRQCVRKGASRGSKPGITCTRCSAMS